MSFLIPLNQHAPTPTFTFADFITALTLLALVYTMTGEQYRFRINIYQRPLRKIAYWTFAIMGVSLLVLGLISNFTHSASMQNFILLAQANLGLIFLLVIFWWLYITFISPPVYKKNNCKHYYDAVFQIVQEGSESKLAMLSKELERSVKNIITYANSNESDYSNKKPSSEYALDLLSLLGNRKLCRYIVSDAPGTGIQFFSEMANQKKYDLPIGAFGRNLTIEAINNRDSSLYHQDHWMNSGLMGHLKPFAKALYTNYKMLQTMSRHPFSSSPLDIPYSEFIKWDPEQCKIYFDCALLCLEFYLNSQYHIDETSLNVFQQIFELVNIASNDIYKVNNMKNWSTADAYKKFDIAVAFIQSTLEIFNKKIEGSGLNNELQKRLPISIKILKTHKTSAYTFLDILARAIYNLFVHASRVRGDPWMCWHIYHNSVWNMTFNPFKNGPVYTAIQRIVQKLIYNRVTQKWQNPQEDWNLLDYESSALLGLCLNVISFNFKKHKNSIQYCRLKICLLRWVQKNLMNEFRKDPSIAMHSITGRIQFDQRNSRILKLPVLNINTNNPQEYLNLKS